MSRDLRDRVTSEMPVQERLITLARALEMNPVDSELRDQYEHAYRERAGGTDLTKMCFIFHDSERARAIHEEAYKRALEFVTLGGVVGDVLEFGVLGGWSSRIFAETMRDLMNLSNLHLFDSFEASPNTSQKLTGRATRLVAERFGKTRCVFRTTS